MPRRRKLTPEEAVKLGLKILDAPFVDLSRLDNIFTELDYGDACECPGRHFSDPVAGRCLEDPEWEVTIRRSGSVGYSVTEQLCTECAQQVRALVRPEVFKVDFLEE